MKNKKGFTLVEMLVVLSVLITIFLIVVPEVTNLYKNLKQSEYERFLSDIFLSTEAYVQKNIDKYPELNNNNQKVYVYFEELLGSGYLKATIIDPKNKKNVKEEDYTVELFLNDDNEYKYKLLEEHYDPDYCEYESGKEWLFDYTGSEQEFVSPCKGKYKLEVWGAQGGNYDSVLVGGYGGYSEGIVSLQRNQNIYINVGEKGKNCVGANCTLSFSYNGGGQCKAYTMSTSSCSTGGGATHIALTSGLLSTFENKENNILIVSGGGGGGTYTNSANNGAGGHAGGYIGTDATNPKNSSDFIGNGYGLGANQSKPGYKYNSKDNSEYCLGQFGLGGYCSSPYTTYAASGGSGLYGGGGSAYTGGGGGSGYIGNSLLTDKTMYCYSCKESTEESTKTVSTTCVNDIPTENCAKKENGYAKITYLG